MKKSIFVLLTVFAGSYAMAQTGTVPPDYPAQLDRSMDSQIEAVRQNYEDVKAKTEAKLAAEKAAAEKAKAKEAARKAAVAKKLAAQKAAEKKKADERAAKLEKRADESAELDLELKRLKVREATAETKVKEAVSEEQIKRAGDIVDAKLKATK